MRSVPHVGTCEDVKTANDKKTSLEVIIVTLRIELQPLHQLARWAAEHANETFKRHE